MKRTKPDPLTLVLGPREIVELARALTYRPTDRLIPPRLPCVFEVDEAPALVAGRRGGKAHALEQRKP